jgi:hypothetical protein
MAATNPKVMAMIEAELAKDPSISNEALLQKAKKVDRSVGQLSARQFNARYPLQVKRRKDGPSAGKKTRRSGKAKSTAAKGAGAKAGKGRTTKTKAKSAAKSGGGRGRKKTSGTGSGRRAAPSAGGGDRDAVRKILLDYARKVSAANSMTDMVDLVMDVDRYVDRVMKAAG